MSTRRIISTVFSLLLLVLAGIPLSAQTQIPFDLNRGLILISATVDGQAGLYILDSGAPGLVLNHKRHLMHAEKPVELAGIGGAVQGDKVSNLVLSFDQLSYSGLDALCVDLGYLESCTNLEIAGLIGLDLFAGKHVLIDYGGHYLTLYDNPGQVFGGVPSVTLPLVSHEHLLILEVPYEGRALRFTFDSGSRSNFISPSALNFIPKWKRNIVGKKEVIGADQMIVTTQELEIYDLITYKQWSESADFVVHDMDGLRQLAKVKLDGILGHEFFRGRKVLISADRASISFSLVSMQYRNSLVTNVR